MKKNFKRNKILLTSLIGLAVLGSATAAFSTWIFGIQQKTAELDGITVEVDTVKDDTAYLDIKVDSNDNKISLAEVDVIDNKNNAVNAGEFTTTSKGDFTIKLSTFDFAISNEYTFNSIDFVLSVTKDNTNSNEVEVTSKDRFEREPNKYNYIVLAKTSYSLEDFDPKANAQLTDYKLYNAKDTTKTITFNWGDFYGINGPANFYNTKYEALGADETLENKLLFIQDAKKEVKTMQTAFTGVTVKITAKLNADKTTGK